VIFPDPLLSATLIRRYKRFLADVELPNGQFTTVHCPNTGSMLGCAEPGMPVWLSQATNTKRKYPFTWELVEVGDDVLVGINTGRANYLIKEAIVGGLLASLKDYTRVRSEVRFGRENSRVDYLLEGTTPPCYLEVKNVTAAVQKGIALFPDAVSQRGTRHLRELMDVLAGGNRAMLCFCVQRADVQEVRPADAIDPAYGATLREAISRGVEVVAIGAQVTPQAIVLNRLLPVVCP
jgi:sugar fermentation stimulation protein A